ncbi:DUF167 domain-containing protein [bacterium]|nr:DUF167 domain-containing protein [bacterium]
MSAPGCRLKVKVVPGAARTEIVGRLGEAVKVRVAAPPEGGRANREVVAVLAERLGLPVAQVTVLSGRSSPAKVIGLAGLTESEALARLLG